MVKSSPFWQCVTKKSLATEQPLQLDLFVQPNALLDAMRELDPDEVSPKQALEALYRLKQLS